MANKQSDNQTGKPKRKKRGLFRLLLVMGMLTAVGLGVTYGLAKFGVIRLPQKPFLTPLYAKIGLKQSTKSTTSVASKPAPDPLLNERKNLEEQRQNLQKEREEWEKQKQESAKREAEAKTQAQATPHKETLDPKNLSRIATIYEEMPTEKVSKILALLPDAQVIELLKRMDEKKVGEILATEKPARAARLSLTIAKTNAAN